MNRSVIALGVLAAVVVTAASSLFTVQQTQQVLITQLGEPIRVIETPGLHVKLPFIQSVITFDRRLLDFDAPGEEVILGDQRRLIVDSFTRYRITNPLEFYRTVGATEQGIRARLNSIVSSSLRRVLGNEPLLSVLMTWAIAQACLFFGLHHATTPYVSCSVYCALVIAHSVNIDTS